MYGHLWIGNSVAQVTWVPITVCSRGCLGVHRRPITIHIAHIKWLFCVYFTFFWTPSSSQLRCLYSRGAYFLWVPIIPILMIYIDTWASVSFNALVIFWWLTGPRSKTAGASGGETEEERRAASQRGSSPGEEEGDRGWETGVYGWIKLAKNISNPHLIDENVSECDLRVHVLVNCIPSLRYVCTCRFRLRNCTLKAVKFLLS